MVFCLQFYNHLFFNLYFISDVGMHVGGESGLNYLVLQVHYLNVSSFKGNVCFYILRIFFLWKFCLPEIFLFLVSQFSLQLVSFSSLLCFLSRSVLFWSIYSSSRASSMNDFNRFTLTATFDTWIIFQKEVFPKRIIIPFIILDGGTDNSGVRVTLDKHK